MSPLGHKRSKRSQDCQERLGRQSRFESDRLAPTAVQDPAIELENICSDRSGLVA